MTVVETVRFQNDADHLTAESDRTRLVDFVGADPAAGDVIPETGGVRKLTMRWQS
jgi:hypothetical protein